MIINGNNIEVLTQLIAEGVQVDSVVTDPPYGLKFMGKKWDYDVPSVEFWKLVLQILRPGGHVLSFGGTRTYHRMVVNLEDAGFEIRDQLVWLYGSGFPKSMDISKAIDKAAGAEREVIGFDSSRVRPNRKYEGGAIGNIGGTGRESDRTDNGATVTAPSTPEAQKWAGWGTALKPAVEPIVLARKPLEESTVAANVLKHGTGGINVDGCRIEGESPCDRTNRSLPVGGIMNGDREQLDAKWQGNSTVRFPANVILDDRAGELLDEQSGITKSVGGSVSGATALGQGSGWNAHNNSIKSIERIGDSGGASRFFYCAKAPKSERRGSNHPTVKPIALMRYLCRLITPPNGTVLDPFAGSGTTGEAAVLEGFNPILIELDPDYIKDIETRLESPMDTTKPPKKVKKPASTANLDFLDDEDAA